MKVKTSNIFWGILFVTLGIILSGNIFWGWSISFWNWAWKLWPLVIIVPSCTGMIRRGFNISSLTGILIGVGFLLMTNDVVEGSMIRSLILPVALILIGLSIIFKSPNDKENYKKREIPERKEPEKRTYENDNIMYGEVENNQNYNQNNNYNKYSSEKKTEYTAIFSSGQYRFPNDEFKGTSINSIFGSVVLDLRDAIITEDVVINCSVIFAGADIYIPGNVNVKVSSVPIFGGVSNKVRNMNVTGPTIYINATCMFGGLDIK